MNFELSILDLYYLLNFILKYHQFIHILNLYIFKYIMAIIIYFLNINLHFNIFLS